nr:hypothetical protein [uncultured Devosia sp.]
MKLNDLSPMAILYIDRIIDTKAYNQPETRDDYWEHEDDPAGDADDTGLGDEEYKSQYTLWENSSPDSFHPLSLEEIQSDCSRFIAYLRAEGGECFDEMDLGEAAKQLWFFRAANGGADHEFDLGGDRLDAAARHIANELGAALAEVLPNGTAIHQHHDR